jgi:hypothetical protein
MSSASQESKRITQAFLTDITPQGIVALKLFHLGAPFTIYLDEIVPFVGSSTMLNFSQPTYTNALYGIFLEKAWAKVNGNYAFIEGGWETEAIRFISGAPTATFQTSPATVMSDW